MSLLRQEKEWQPRYLQSLGSCLWKANDMVVLQLGCNDVTSAHVGKGWLGHVQLVQHDAKGVHIKLLQAVETL